MRKRLFKVYCGIRDVRSLSTGSKLSKSSVPECNSETKPGASVGDWPLVLVTSPKRRNKPLFASE